MFDDFWNHLAPRLTDLLGHHYLWHYYTYFQYFSGHRHLKLKCRESSSQAPAAAHRPQDPRSHS